MIVQGYRWNYSNEGSFLEIFWNYPDRFLWFRAYLYYSVMWSSSNSDLPFLKPHCELLSRLWCSRKASTCWETGLLITCLVGWNSNHCWTESSLLSTVDNKKTGTKIFELLSKSKVDNKREYLLFWPIYIWLISNGVTSVCFAVDNNCKTLLYGGVRITVYTDKWCQRANDFELFRYHLMAVDNNRNLQMVFRSTSRTLDFRRSVFFSCILRDVQIKFGVVRLWLSFGRRSCLVFWKSAKLISACKRSCTFRCKSLE